MADRIGRVAQAIHANWPYVRCTACLGTLLELTEAAVRQATRLLLTRQPGGFVLERRVCSSCQHLGDVLVEKERRSHR